MTREIQEITSKHLTSQINWNAFSCYPHDLVDNDLSYILIVSRPVFHGTHVIDNNLYDLCNVQNLNSCMRDAQH